MITKCHTRNVENLQAEMLLITAVLFGAAHFESGTVAWPGEIDGNTVCRIHPGASREMLTKPSRVTSSQMQCGRA